MTVEELRKILDKCRGDEIVYIEHPFGTDAYVYNFMEGARKEDDNILILYGA